MSRRILMWEHHAWESPIRVGGRAFAESFLGAGWSVAWINGPLAPWNLLGGNDEIVRRRRSWRMRGVEARLHGGRLFRYAPLGCVPYRPYPLLDRPWFHRHSLALTLPSLRGVLEKRGFAAIDLLWLATGSPMLPLLDWHPEAISVYRLSDETSAFPDTPRSYRRIEEEAMSRVDYVVATAASLAERASRFCRKVLLLPNGVDGSRFEDAAGQERVSPRAGAARRIVYVGALDSWFDRGKVEALCRAFPQDELLLAGPIRMETEWASDHPNLRLLGPIPHEEVPALLSGCEVGIIPFIDSELTRAIHPVKLYEYFAAGLPVVASDLDEIRRIGSPAILARTDSDWVAGVRSAFASPHRRDYREFAARNDWSARFARLMEFLEESKPEPAPLRARMAR